MNFEPCAFDLRPALDLICDFEGFYADAYLCPAGVPTIGYGTIRYPNGERVKIGDKITHVDATRFLCFEVDEITRRLKNLIKVPVSNNQFCALVSFCYNVGVNAFRRSTLLRRLNNGEPAKDVAAEFIRWIYADGHLLNGLIRRRAAERDLFLA